MSKLPSRGQRIRDAFFTESDKNSNEWICKCGTRRKQTGHGYTNLVSHVEKQHPTDLQTLLSDAGYAENSSASESLFFNSKTVQMHGWLDLVLNGLLPFCIVDNPVFIRCVKFKPIARNTLSKYMSLLTQRVEQKVSAILPDKFAVIFDGWTANQTHFVGLFATFPSTATCGYDCVLLGFSPFENEESLSARAHLEYVTYVLGLFNRSLSNVVAFVGDNCSTNTSFASMVSGHYVGCASHRFNLALKDIFKEANTFIEKVHSVMKALRRPILAAKLRVHTHLRPSIHTPTR